MRSVFNFFRSGNQLSKDACIGEGTIVGKDILIEGTVVIGQKCRIGRNVIIKGNVNIGDGTVIGYNVTINEYMKGKVLIGNKTTIQKNVDLGGNITIGDECVVASNTLLKTMPEGQILIGKDVLINSFTIIGAGKLVEIKDHCIFAAYVQILDSSHTYDNVDVPIKHSRTIVEATCIEEDVWLGSGVVVLMGCTIGKGSVIGAKSLITKNIPPYSIAYGTPAIVQGSRNLKEKE